MQQQYYESKIIRFVVSGDDVCKQRELHTNTLLKIPITCYMEQQLL